MNTVAIIQARMGSTRLPGKVLKPILGQPMLAREVARVARAKLVDQIVIATSTNPADSSIAALADALGLACYRGSEIDVLDRFYQTAQKFSADPIIRLTSDCPLIDPQIIDQTVSVFTSSSADYVSNHHLRSFPVGMDVEVVKFRALELAWRQADSAYDREHATAYVYNPAHHFRLKGIVAPAQLRRPKLRLTVDELADLKLVRRIYQLLYPSKPDFTLKDILNLLDANPNLVKINLPVIQKPAKYYKALLLPGH
ncbi:MAG: hypothetical protein A2784_04090 [Candidatus Chisholmbacteria bacterium RIFCSPHIGHO2_01_FULL_48_12]|uniref:Acylneuraminate cytidylyltransferase n=1 Tax=Candidatus Chisholmbacteria bacterium RIFCSPHIGHO2_01_FULL_48_12 TaxID=1797589 RepID=A0A1G1VNL7_9BACT|nr:MAG: hypothetical protein A2784_04090 [Candidatus Chisholmbacteria bacterium RIFCSPHIGHO2_01_FULL_48_12]